MDKATKVLNNAVPEVVKAVEQGRMAHGGTGKAIKRHKCRLIFRIFIRGKPPKCSMLASGATPGQSICQLAYPPDDGVSGSRAESHQSWHDPFVPRCRIDEFPLLFSVPPRCQVPRSQGPSVDIDSGWGVGTWI